MLYAKSNPEESIGEHTNKLLENFEVLKNTYSNEIEKNMEDKERFWELLRIACLYHDIGKVYTPFQNIVLKELNKPLIPTNFTYDYIKHEQLSLAFFPAKQFGITKDEKKLLYQTIFYHHERKNFNIDYEMIDKIIEKDFMPHIDSIEIELRNDLDIAFPEKLSSAYLTYVKPEKRINSFDSLYIEYCLLKGLLHRIDHSSSAHIEVEETTSDNVAEFTENSMNNKNFKLNDIQIYCKDNSDENLILIGSTGIGKTEAALMWSNNSKAFFTLPIRISINAIYDRIYQEIGYKHIGLLHSGALDYLEENYEFENTEQIYNQSKNFSRKLTVCTIDQIFPFVFKYKGYEKIYATFSYSKIIIDEIQAYSPEIVAILIKGIEMIHKIGGKFLVMTATLPRIYKDKFKELGIPFKEEKFLKPVKRHKISIRENNIFDDLDFISNLANDSKVLIIANTVNKSIEIYKSLKEVFDGEINLLHSKFTGEDRNIKESKIKDFSANKNEKGIWITTQLVEASLDIDFDYLFTEMSTLDSLFQRLGRCYRKREYDLDLPNVYIYDKDISGIGSKSVYDEDIHQKSLELLKEYNNELLREEDKVDMVDKLYSMENIKDTDFYKDFKAGLNVLDNIIDYDTSKSDAQKLLRKIDNVTVIPMSVYQDNLELFKLYESTKGLHEKNKLLRKITNLSTNITKYQYNCFKDKISEIPYLNEKIEIYLVNLKYSDELGLVLKDDEDYSLDDRFCD